MEHLEFHDVNRKMSNIITRFLNKNLSHKFRFIYVILITISTLFSLILVTTFYNHFVAKSIQSLALQTLQTASNNCDSMIGIISKNSTYILGGNTVQKYLTSGVSSSERTILSKQLRNSLYLSLESIPFASSIIVMDREGHFEYASRYTLPKMNIDHISETNWYEKVYKLQGAPCFTINGGGIFKEPDVNHLSLVRLINSTDDAKPLGYLMINVPMTSLLNVSQIGNNSSDFCIYADDVLLMSFKNLDINTYFKTHSIQKVSNSKNKTIQMNGNKYFLLSMENESLGLTYFSLTPYLQISSSYIPFLLISFIIIFISFIMLVLIASCTNYFVTNPLNRLSNAMESADQGDFSNVNVTPYNDEIGMLQNSYNEMLVKINNLLIAKVNEQKQLKNYELQILQEQIKPHFLYNSLSGIAYLINSKQNHQAKELVMALSEYYRESLSKGSELISLRTEINIVKNYLLLQQMRFPNAFEVRYSLDDNLLDFIVPRLILQPLVENAIYHGIIPTCDFGIISISVYKQADFVIIEVSDDGMGMEQDLLNHLHSNENQLPLTSFGLRGTIERLKLLYSRDDIYDVWSSHNEGTRITLKLPVQKE